MQQVEITLKNTGDQTPDLQCPVRDRKLSSRFADGDIYVHDCMPFFVFLTFFVVLLYISAKCCGMRVDK